MSPSTSWRAHYAAALYATGVPWQTIALALGNFVRPVTRQRVFQLIDKAGLDWRRHDAITDAHIDAAIARARAAGLARRADIFAAVCAALPDAAKHRVRSRITAATGVRQDRYIPPPGTPEGWRWCIHCQAFAPPSSRGSHCPKHYNEAARRIGDARRRAQGKKEIGSREAIRARALAALADYRAGVGGVREVCAAHRIAVNTFYHYAFEEEARRVA